MRIHFRHAGLIMMLAAVFLGLRPHTGVAQAAKPTPTSGSPGVPRLADGTPDLNGVWERPYVPDMTRTSRDQQGPTVLPYTPAGAEKFKSYDAAKFDYTGHCLPQGMTRSMNSPFPIEIVQAPKRVAILFEAWNVFHVVPTDGRGFPKDAQPTWIGTSIGRWDGDTLVVETTNYRTGFMGSTPDVKVTERYTRVSADHINWVITVDDAKTWTQPWSFMVRLKKTNDSVYEYACHEGNHSMTGILAGARAAEKEAAAAAKAKSSKN
jgi:hypothetical protein